MAAADVTVFGRIIARFACSKRYIVYVTAEQPAAAREGCDFSARFRNRRELAWVVALKHFHYGLLTILTRTREAKTSCSG
jgi:hypothetical protein